MKLLKMTMSKAELLSIPIKERNFFIQSARIMDEISILNKAVMFSSNEQDNEIIRKAQSSQALFFAVIMAGKIFECWEFIKRNFFGSGISKKFESKLSEQDKENLDEIKKYFGKDNLICLVRNKFAFHYDSSGKSETEIEDILGDEPLELFIAKSRGDCLHYIAHILTYNKLLKSINPIDRQGAMKQFLSENFDIERRLLDFLGEIIMLIVDEYTLKHSEWITLPEPAHADTISLPFFFGPSDMKD